MQAPAGAGHAAANVRSEAVEGDERLLRLEVRSAPSSATALPCAYHSESIPNESRIHLPDTFRQSQVDITAEEYGDVCSVRWECIHNVCKQLMHCQMMHRHNV